VRNGVRVRVRVRIRVRDRVRDRVTVRVRLFSRCAMRCAICVAPNTESPESDVDDEFTEMVIAGIRPIAKDKLKRN